ncbi:MAG: cytochrome c oxidase subunit II [Acidobacteria bacterium]|nr:cytochrome c oxidase subunit II [Acidobacteriota bacterium]
MNWFRQLILPIEGSTLARDVDNAYLFVTLVSLFFFVLVAGLAALFVWRYRRRGPNEITPHITHNLGLEVTWTTIPLVLVMGLFFWGFYGFMRAQIAPGEAMEVQVTAKKWQWQFEYPDGMRTLNELHVPLGKPVRLVMTAEDVLHSFYVPSFRVKHDVIPNRYTEVWFEPTKAGTHQVFCTEYCGKGHSDMLAKIVVEDEQSYQKWLIEGDESMKSMPLAELGKLVWENRGCSTCHALDGTRGQGPSWKGIFGQTHKFADGASAPVDANYIRESLMEPQKHVVQGFEGIMPTYQGLLRPREVLGVIEFIKTLK